MSDTPKLEDLTVSDISVLLSAASDKETEEFNELFDELEKTKSFYTNSQLAIKNMQEKLDGVLEENSKLVEIVHNFEKSSETIINNGEKHLNAAEQARREKNQALAKVGDLQETIKTYKELGTPKKIREKIKNYQTKAADNVKAINLKNEEIKGFKREIVKLTDSVVFLENELDNVTISTVYSEGKDNLLMFPVKLTMQVQDREEKQLTLLYMDDSGCGKLIGLDDEDKPAICSMPKSGLRPKKSTLDKAGSFLRKAKRQGWKLTRSDLTLL